MKIGALKKKILFVVLIVVAVAAAVAYKEYNRKPADLATLKPELEVPADDLIAAYATDEAKANQQYLGKVVEVTGLVSGGTTANNILLGTSPNAKVSCLLDSAHTLQNKAIKPGDKLRLRGVCTGFLLDVELNRCVIVE